MAYANFKAELAKKNFIDRDPLKLLNPEYVSILMNKDKELRTLFEELIGARHVIESQSYCRTSVHERADAPINSELSVFYRYFISKCYFNLKKQNAQSQLLDNYASIFPFKVDDGVEIDAVPIMDLFGDEFLREIEDFIICHVPDSDFNDLEYLLIKNIESFRQKNFSKRFPINYVRLKAIAEIGSHESDEPEEPVGYLCDYLNHVTRLNEAGVDWYMNMQKACNEVNAMYNKDLIPAKGKAYFKYLPEINCCELLLLLERRFYVEEYEKYVKLFKKYLFFFGHAVDFAEHVHPVFFIDDALFACLTSLRTYLFSRTNVFEMEYELWMVALVHLRTYPFSKSKGPIERTVDQQNLQRVANYVAKTLSTDAWVYYETSLLYPIRDRNFYVRGDTVYRLMFVDVPRLALRHFYELILKAALLEKEKIAKIVIYNAYTGEEMIIQMPHTVDDIRNLIVAMHLEIVRVLRDGRHGLPLKKAVELCKLYRFEWPQPAENPTLESFLTYDRECFFVTSAVEEDIDEPFSFSRVTDIFERCACLMSIMQISGIRRIRSNDFNYISSSSSETFLSVQSI